ncbi:MAG: GGDEF domain-containing protein [Bacillota bacterium]|nr:GGDEF domain-containing protein [Bacillota bacterium]
MKEKLYKHAPLVLLLAGLLLWFAALSIDRFYHKQVLVWMPFVIIQLIVSTACGILIRTLYQQVHMDALTGLRNRKYFFAKLSEIKTKTPVSLILIDIDNFKGINDTYGHMVGDHVLHQFGEILQNSTRKNDIIARWGGEEFAVILFHTDTEEAFNIADRIRTVVEDHVFSCETITCKITISIGIASIEEGKDVGTEQFIRVADEALYRAKEKKNYIVIDADCR